LITAYILLHLQILGNGNWTNHLNICRCRLEEWSVILDLCITLHLQNSK
jgi:hypothetical protein